MVLLVHAVINETSNVIHTAELCVGSDGDHALLFRCLKKVVDGRAGALALIRDPTWDVSCMMCLACECQ